jgi:hypothetical protein
VKALVVPCNHGLFLKFQELFFLSKNSVRISVLGISEKARGVTSKAACGILISVSIFPYKTSRHFLEFERHSILVGVVFLYLKVLL